MKHYMSVLIAFAVVASSGVASAGPVPTLTISMATRETGTVAAGVPIGGNGGGGAAATGSSIEWLNLDGQTLVLDGTWQQFTFDISAVPVTFFAGVQPPGGMPNQVDGTAGTLEHIRFRNTGTTPTPITLWIDDVVDNIDPNGPLPPGPTDMSVQDFEGFMSGAEVTFQEPHFSGSTSGFVEMVGQFAGVDNTVFHSGAASYRVEFSWEPDDIANLAAWLRLTTATGAGTLDINPTIAYDQDSIVSFWIMGVPEPATLSLLVVGGLLAVRRRRAA